MVPTATPVGTGKPLRTARARIAAPHPVGPAGATVRPAARLTGGHRTPWRWLVRGSVLLLLVACLSALVVGFVVEGLFWLAVVSLALLLGVGALALSRLHFRA